VAVFLPDGRHFVFLGDAANHRESSTFASAHSIRRNSDPLQRGDAGSVCAPGFLTLCQPGALVAQPFDPQKLKSYGGIDFVAERIATVGGNHEFDFSVSD
jgi:hypothetical protein